MAKRISTSLGQTRVMGKKHPEEKETPAKGRSLFFVGFPDRMHNQFLHVDSIVSLAGLSGFNA